MKTMIILFLMLLATFILVSGCNPPYACSKCEYLGSKIHAGFARYAIYSYKCGDVFEESLKKRTLCD